jgi:hypothetical protein
MEINPEETKKVIVKRTLYNFVPHRLEIPERPELNRFPFNILFTSFTIKNRQRVNCSALYQPIIDSYRKDGNLSSMEYRNIYGGNCYLTISYDEGKKQYHGEKYVNNKNVGSADGGDNWNMFFVHLTMSGLANGEQCMFGEP